MASLAVAESELQPDGRVIAITGELDLAVVDRVNEAFGRAAGCKEVLVDLSGCEFIDSTDIAAFLLADKALRREGGRLALFGATAQVARVLELVGLTDKDMVFSTLEEARMTIPPN